jgi:hypothetical protein
VAPVVAGRAMFRKKIEDQGIIEMMPGQKRRGGQHRPAQRYRLKQGVPAEFERKITPEEA